MTGSSRYSVRVEGAKYGVSFGTALAIAISYTTNHSILWAIVHGIFEPGSTSSTSRCFGRSRDRGQLRMLKDTIP